jgi:hypothetical protein
MSVIQKGEGLIPSSRRKTDEFVKSQLSPFRSWFDIFDTSGQALPTKGISATYGRFHPFALRYRRVNGTFYERIKTPVAKSPSLL